MILCHRNIWCTQRKMSHFDADTLKNWNRIFDLPFEHVNECCFELLFSMRHARFSIKHLGIRKKRIFIIVVLKTPLKGVKLASVLRIIVNAHQVYISSRNVCERNLLTAYHFYSVSVVEVWGKLLLKVDRRNHLKTK